MVFNFFDLGAWLCDAERGAGADDQIENVHGLTAYARRDSAEDFSRLKARRCTAMDWILIPACCFVLP